MIEVIYGPMFSGKTEELIRRINLAKLKQFRVASFKSSVDKRYHNDFIVSHNQEKHRAKAISSLKEINPINYDFIAIDEFQFFPEQEVPLLQELSEKVKVVLVAGLALDYKAQPFGSMAAAINIAHTPYKLQAECQICSQPAEYSFRKSDDQSQLLIGEKDLYEARCKNHFFDAPK